MHQYLLKPERFSLRIQQDVRVRGFDQGGVKFDEAALAANIGLAGRYPHSIQMLGYHPMEIDKDKVIDQEDWTGAVLDPAIELRTRTFQ